MKRWVLVLLTVFCVFLHADCAGTALAADDVNWANFVFDEEPASTPEPVKVVHITAEERKQREEKIARYEAQLDRIAALFGFDDGLEYPYFPTHIDPVCYFNYLSMTSGFKNGDVYAVYDQFYEAVVEDYLQFLANWGYVISEHSCALPGVREWHAVCPSPRTDGKGLLERVRVYHVPDEEVLVVAYPYLDEFLYEKWSESTLNYPYWKAMLSEPLPCTVQLAQDCAVTIEEIRYIEEASICAEREQALYALTSRGLVHDRLLVQNPQDNAWILRVPNEPDDKYPDRMMSLRLTFDKPVDKAFVDQLRLAEADVSSRYSHLAGIPMLYAWENDGVLSAWTAETESASLCVLFPPKQYNEYESKRVYMRIQDEGQPWIGDLRQWTYAEVYQP